MDVVELGKQSASQSKVMVPRVKIWTRLSPMYIFRVFRDTYVRGCVTFGNSSKVNAIAHGAAFQISCKENSFSRSSSQCVRDSVSSAQELLELSAKFSREVSEQESVQSGHKHLAAITGTNGLTLADLQGYASASPGCSPLRMSDRVAKLKLTDIQSHSGPLRKKGASGSPLNDLQGHSGPLRARPSFDAVPESEQYTDPRLSTSSSRLKMQHLFQTSALHPKEFLQSSSRRVTSLDSSYQLGLPHQRTSSFAMKRAASERMRTLSRDASTSDDPNKPVSPLPRASSRRPERFASMPSSITMNSSRRVVAPFDDIVRSRSGKSKSANKPNPYREYDTRLPSTPLSV